MSLKHGALQEEGRWRDLGLWVKKQRKVWQQGTLLDDKMQILSSLGFEIGFEAQITPEWEEKFDQLLEWLLIMVRLYSVESIPSTHLYGLIILMLTSLLIHASRIEKVFSIFICSWSAPDFRQSFIVTILVESSFNDMHKFEVM